MHFQGDSFTRLTGMCWPWAGGLSPLPWGSICPELLLESYSMVLGFPEVSGWRDKRGGGAPVSLQSTQEGSTQEGAP